MNLHEEMVALRGEIEMMQARRDENERRFRKMTREGLDRRREKMFLRSDRELCRKLGFRKKVARYDEVTLALATQDRSRS